MKDANKNKCTTCKELNEEKNEISIDSIYIQSAGYYNWHRVIKFCPDCGKILDKYSSNC